jgi:integrase
MKGLRQKGRAWYYDAGGKPRRWIALGTDEAVAMKKYRALVAKPKAKAPEPGTVDKMIADYLEHPRAPLAQNTLKLYRILRGHVSSVFGHLDPSSLTQADIMRYLKNCQRMSVRNEIGLLSMAYANWILDGRLIFNPCFGVHMKLPVSRRTRLLSGKEINAVLREADERLAVAIELAYATGLRIGDLCLLRWVDIEGNVRTQKTGARQEFQMTEWLRAILDRARALQARNASLYVLVYRGDRPWRQNTLRETWYRACARAGVEDAHFHDLRAAGATELDRAGGNAQKFLGHRRRTTTETYLRDRSPNVIVPLKRKA